MSNKDPIAWAEQAGKQTLDAGMGAVRSVISTAISMLTLRLAIFLTKLLAMPLEVLYRKRAGVRYFSPFWLSLQTIALAVITVALAGFVLSGGDVNPFRMNRGGGDSLRLLPPIVAMLFAGTLTWASAEHLFGSWKRILRRQLSYTMHEGSPRFLFPGVHLVRSQMWREILNDFVWTVMLAVFFLVSGAMLLALLVWGSFMSMTMCRLLVLHQVWGGVFDVVDNHYLEIHRQHVGELVDNHIEQPLAEPFRKYLGKLERTDHEQQQP